MRDIKRIEEFLSILKVYWEKYVPDWRFMQLICNLQSFCGSDMFYYEEDKIIDVLNRYFDDEGYK